MRSAAEIIELIKKLPPKEQAEVRPAKDEQETRTISDEKFAEVAPQVFTKHRDLLRRLAQ